MTKRIIAIAFIFGCTSGRRGILGGTIFSRTYSSDAVAKEWPQRGGLPQNPAPPTLHLRGSSHERREHREWEKDREDRAGSWYNSASLREKRSGVALQLEHRQKGLLWYSTYQVAFSGVLRVRNTSARRREPWTSL